MARSHRRSVRFCAPAIAAALDLCFASNAAAQDVRVSTGTIEDRRTTGRFFGGLEVELKLTGDDVADAKASRLLLKKAVDESGRDLLPEKKDEPDFQDGTSNLRLNLKNPSRGAGALKELAGDVELFVPSRDKAATVVIDRVVSKMDKPLDSPGLRAQKVSIRLVSPKTYREGAKKREAELDKEMAKHKAEMEKAAAEEGADPKQVEALMALVKGFAGMMSEVGDNDLVMEIDDPGKKLVDVEVVGADGNVISSQGSMTSGGLKVVNFAQKLPPDAKLRLLLRTKGAVVRTAFNLTNVPLP